MSWEEAEFSIKVFSNRTTYSLINFYPHTITSCSTVLIGASMFASAKMRLYGATLTFSGTTHANFYQACTLAEESAWTVDASLHTALGEMITFIDSDPIHSLLFTDIFGGFEVRTWHPAQHFATALVHKKTGMEWGYTYLYFISNMRFEYNVPPTAGYTWSVTYKDPHVLELSGGRGWLMILTRVRNSDFETVNSFGGVAGDTPGLCLSDLVLWWSEDPSFKGPTVVGPFQLVDSLHAWPGVSPIRLWLGTASAVVVEQNGQEKLVVYVSAQRNCRVQLMAPYPIDDILGGDYNTVLEAAGFTGACVAVVTMDLEEIMVRISSERWHVRVFGKPYYTDESTWTSDTIPGSTAALGPIQVFIAWPGGFFRRFESVYQDSSTGLSPVFSDPAAMTCDNRVSLFASSLIDGELGIGVTMTPSGTAQLGSGHGIWRLRGVAEGDLFDIIDTDSLPAKVTADFATCFVVARPGNDMPDVGLHSPDQLCESDSSTLLVRKDPDPTRTPSGAWWVNVGGGAGNALTRFVGTAEDGCGTADDLIAEAGTNRARLYIPVIRCPQPTPAGLGLAISESGLEDGRLRQRFPEEALGLLARQGWTMDYVVCELPRMEGAP